MYNPGPPEDQELAKKIDLCKFPNAPVSGDELMRILKAREDERKEGNPHDQ